MTEDLRKVAEGLASQIAHEDWGKNCCDALRPEIYGRGPCNCSRAEAVFAILARFQADQEEIERLKVWKTRTAVEQFKRAEAAEAKVKELENARTVQLATGAGVEHVRKRKVDQLTDNLSIATQCAVIAEAKAQRAEARVKELEADLTEFRNAEKMPDSRVYLLPDTANLRRLLEAEGNNYRLEQKVASLEKKRDQLIREYDLWKEIEGGKIRAEGKREGVETAAKVAADMAERSRFVLQRLDVKKIPFGRDNHDLIRTRHGANVAGDIAAAIRALLPAESAEEGKGER